MIVISTSAILGGEALTKNAPGKCNIRWTAVDGRPTGVLHFIQFTMCHDGSQAHPPHHLLNTVFSGRASSTVLQHIPQVLSNTSHLCLSLCLGS